MNRRTVLTSLGAVMIAPFAAVFGAVRGRPRIVTQEDFLDPLLVQLANTLRIAGPGKFKAPRGYRAHWYLARDYRSHNVFVLHIDCEPLDHAKKLPYLTKQVVFDQRELHTRWQDGFPLKGVHRRLGILDLTPFEETTMYAEEPSVMAPYDGAFDEA